MLLKLLFAVAPFPAAFNFHTRLHLLLKMAVVVELLEYFDAAFEGAANLVENVL